VSESPGTTHLCFGDLAAAAGDDHKVPEYLGFVAEEGTITPVSTDDRLKEVWTLSQLSAHGVGIWSGDKDIHASVHVAASQAGLGYMGAIRTGILDYPIVFFGWAEHFKLDRVMDVEGGEVVEGSDRSGLQWKEAAALTAEEPAKEAAPPDDESFSITTDPDEALAILESRKHDAEVLSLNDRAADVMDTGDYDAAHQLLHQALELRRLRALSRAGRASQSGWSGRGQV
jgi:hypothetical protein